MGSASSRSMIPSESESEASTSMSTEPSISWSTREGSHLLKLSGGGNLTCVSSYSDSSWVATAICPAMSFMLSLQVSIGCSSTAFWRTSSGATCTLRGSSDSPSSIKHSSGSHTLAEIFPRNLTCVVPSDGSSCRTLPTRPHTDKKRSSHLITSCASMAGRSFSAVTTRTRRRARGPTKPCACAIAKRLGSSSTQFKSSSRVMELGSGVRCTSVPSSHSLNHRVRSSPSSFSGGPPSKTRSSRRSSRPGPFSSSSLLRGHSSVVKDWPFSLSSFGLASPFSLWLVSCSILRTRLYLCSTAASRVKPARSAMPA
mmetsp:Transcript_26403/g.62960  ORF Transcript_26403/g.62960 Transcript_26403/m.62960 type:complete len:313 (+) Transcript_26403:357-1295(+)